MVFSAMFDSPEKKQETPVVEVFPLNEVIRCDSYVRMWSQCKPVRPRADIDFDAKYSLTCLS